MISDKKVSHSKINVHYLQAAQLVEFDTYSGSTNEEIKFLSSREFNLFPSMQMYCSHICKTIEEHNDGFTLDDVFQGSYYLHFKQAHKSSVSVSDHGHDEFEFQYFCLFLSNINSFLSLSEKRFATYDRHYKTPSPFNPSNTDHVDLS